MPWMALFQMWGQRWLTLKNQQVGISLPKGTARKLTKQSAVPNHEPVLTFIVSTGFLF
jgi:hypothetical protein